MEYIAAYQNQIKKATSRSEIEKLVGDLIVLNSGVIIQDVRKRWQYGQSVEGGIIGTYKWEEYRLFKQAENPLAGGNVDLMLTGNLSEGLAIRKMGKEYQIFSVDEKYQKIGKKYGFEEFGLTPEQLHEFINDLYEVAFQTILGKIWE